MSFQSLEYRTCPICGTESNIEEFNRRKRIGKAANFESVKFYLTPNGLIKKPFKVGAPSESTYAVSYTTSTHYNKEVEFPDQYDNVIEVEYYLCPACHQWSRSVYDRESRGFVVFRPIVEEGEFSKQLSRRTYRDYKEAVAVLELSPRASAVLARRCLQDMIHKHWGIHLDTLDDEIKAIPKDKISEMEKNTLLSIKNIGNAGAHPHDIVEVTREDAKLLIKSIEFFLKKWYEDKQNEKLQKEIIKRGNEILKEKKAKLKKST